MTDYLNRAAAPFDDELWERLDQAAVKAARVLLTGRRFLDVDGPYGVGLTTIEIGHDDYCRQPGPGEAGAVMGTAISVPLLRKAFSLSIRRVAAWREQGQPLDLAPVEAAAEALALREEEFVYYGQPAFNLHGLMNAPGRHQIKGGDWSKVDVALNDALAAVNALDDHGFRGPYALALEPALHNGLYRRYEGTDMLQIEHLGRLCAAGIFKAPVKGAVVVDPRAASIVVGQDLRAGYGGTDGVHHQMYLTESLALKLDEPGGVCTIETSTTAGRGRPRAADQATRA